MYAVSLMIFDLCPRIKKALRQVYIECNDYHE